MSDLDQLSHYSSNGCAIHLWIQNHKNNIKPETEGDRAEEN